MKRYPFHPFLFVLFPIFSILAKNISEIDTLVVPLFWIILLSFIVLLLQWFLTYLLKDKQKSSNILSLFILFFFSYGAFSAILMKFKFGEFIFVRNFHRFPVYVMLFIFLGYLYIKIINKLKNSTEFLNFVSLILILLSLLKIGMHCINFYISQPKEQLEYNRIVKSDFKKSNYPDIYYIILDGYAREDTLKEIFNYDNSEFIQYLKNKGFYIPKFSKSNYAMTGLSIPSSLAMDYLKSQNIKPPNKVKDFLISYGYKYIEKSSFFNQPYLREKNYYIKILYSEFSQILLKISILDVLANRFNLYGEICRKDILDSFKYLEKVSKISGPKFVYAHILAPHPPYVFGQNGERTKLNLGVSFNIYKTFWDNKEGYINQLIFINKKVKEIIEIILKNSSTQPIIILQADHGPHLEIDYEKKVKTALRIFTAFYLPNKDKMIMYDTITPVNIFRVLFNHYFNANMEILKDKIYFSLNEMPYKYVEVTGKFD